MRTSLQNTPDDIKSKKDKDSGIPTCRQTHRKLNLDELLDKFEKAQVDTRRSIEDREWLNSAPVGKELL